MAARKSSQRDSKRKKIEPLTKVVSLGRFVNEGSLRAKDYNCPSDCKSLTIILGESGVVPSALVVAL